MKNILILATVGGFLDKFERGNVKILQNMGYTVHYAANMAEQHYLFEEEWMKELNVHMHHIDIARSPYMFNYNLKALRQLREIVEQNDICAIHCHTPVGGMLGRMIGWRFRKKDLIVMYTAHGFHFYRGAPFINNTVYYLVERILARYTDIIVVINREDYVNAKKFHLKQGGEVYRVPGVGLNRSRFAPMSPEKKQKARERLGLENDDFFIVSVGELNENKNHEILLRALVAMRQQGKDISHIKYGICGDGFLREQLERKIQELELQDTVTMYGYCMHVEEILGCADVSAFPSKREGLGMAGLEALGMGIPLLASDNRGTREYVEQGQNGYFCRCDDVQDWINGIETIQQMTDKERKEMQRLCRKSVELFDQRNTDSIMKLVYKDLDAKLGCVHYGKEENKSSELWGSTG